MTHRSDEILIVVDEDDNVVGKAPYSKVIAGKLITRGSNIIILNSLGKMFVHKRNRNLTIYGGMWDVKVGGSVGYPESYEEAAVRELREETGININEDELDFLFSTKYRSKIHNVNRKVFRIIYDGKMSLQESEVEEGRFISLDEAKKIVSEGKCSPSAKEVFEEYIKLCIAEKNIQKF